MHYDDRHLESIFLRRSAKRYYIMLPPEDPKAGDGITCGKLLKSLYGTRDASANWHKSYSDFLKSVGFIQCVANPCHFFEPAQESEV